MKGYLAQLFVFLFTYVFLLHWDSQGDQKETRRFIKFFIAAGAGSVYFSLIFYYLGEYLFPKVASGSTLTLYSFYVLLINAPAEELGKFTTFFILTNTLKSIKEPLDGVLQGAALGLGFGVLENLMYGSALGEETLIYRALFLMPGHVIFGAIWGGIYAASYYEGQGRITKGHHILIALLPSWLFHSVHNIAATLGMIELMYVVDTIALGSAVLIFRYLKNISPYSFLVPYRSWSLALPRLRKALTINKDSYELNRRYGCFLMAAGKPEQALGIFRHMEKRHPGRSLNYFLLSTALWSLGRRAEAASAIQNYKKIEKWMPALVLVRRARLFRTGPGYETLFKPDQGGILEDASKNSQGRSLRTPRRGGLGNPLKPKTPQEAWKWYVKGS